MRKPKIKELEDSVPSEGLVSLSVSVLRRTVLINSCLSHSGGLILGSSYKACPLLSYWMLSFST